MNCRTCDREIDPGNPGNLIEVLGYVVQQRPGGGVNHVIDRRPTGKVLCPDCAVRLRLWGGHEQESLL